MKVKVDLDYREQRRNGYPALADQLDAIWKGGQAAEEMRQKVLEVKEKYPKTDAVSG